MDTTTHLLPIIASTRIEISNSFQKRTSLINLIKNSHLELRHIPFERTDVPTFKRIREEFNSSIRPIFLKYLWKVENSFIKKHFTFFEQEKIMTGYLPIGWTVHHQRPISCGGLNYSKEFDKKIRKVPLTLEDLTHTRSTASTLSC